MIDLIYRAVRGLRTFLKSPIERSTARRKLQWMADSLKIPPVIIPPLKVPQIWGAATKRIVKRIAVIGAEHCGSTAIRLHLKSQIKVAVGAAPRWSDRVSASRWCSKLSEADFQSYDNASLGKLSSMPSLRAVRSSWRLPLWPTREAIRDGLDRQWKTWTTQVRLKKNAFFAAKAVLEKWVASCEISQAPVKWAEAEERMVETLSGGEDRRLRALADDDRDGGKKWTVHAHELSLALLAGVLSDPVWTGP